MWQVLMRAFAFVFIIIMGYVLKKIGFFKENERSVISRIVINITLPAAIISSFGKFEKDNSLFFLVVLGLLCNVIMVFLGYVFSKEKGNSVRALYMLNFSGYNIGAFSLPFVQSFIGPFAVIAICMFDIGNSVSCTGGSYAVTSALTDSREKFSLSFIFKRLFSSVPFVVYLVMLMFAVLNIKIPLFITSVTDIIGYANGFASMLMIGLMFEIKFRYDYMAKAGVILLSRYVVSAVLAFIFYNFLPFPEEVCQVLAIAVLAPISALSPVFTEKCGGDTGIAGFAGSMSILISIAVITSLLSLWA